MSNNYEQNHIPLEIVHRNAIRYPGRFLLPLYHNPSIFLYHPPCPSQATSSCPGQQQIIHHAALPPLSPQTTAPSSIQNKP